MRNYIVLLCLLLSAFAADAQKSLGLHYTAGIGTFTFSNGTVMVDPGPNWKGYYLPRDKETGLQIFAGIGTKVLKRLYIGVNGGYAQFQGINGLLAYGSISGDLLKTRLTPFLYLEPGYSHFWNQYPGGTGTAMLGYGIGARYGLRGTKSVRLSFGGLMMQQNAYLTVKAAYGL